MLAASDGVATLDRDRIAEVIGRHRDDGAEAVKEGLLDAITAKAAPEQDHATVAVLEARPDAGDRS